MTTEKRTAGMTFYRQDNGILVYRFLDNRRETIDAWIEQALQDELAIHAEGGDACLLLDIRGQWVTPYALTKVMQTLNLTPPGLQEWVAILTGDSFAGRVMARLMHRFPTSVRESTRLFQTEEPALRWLEQKQQEYQIAKKPE